MTIADHSIVSSSLYSTVAELIEEIQDRIPEDKIDSIFPVLNRAIRAIHKRLFVLRSDLIIGKLSLDIYAEVTQTALTIAFASGVPPTITDSASGFVTAGFYAGMYVDTDSTTNPGPFRVETVAADTLTLARTDSVTTEALGTSRTITSDSQRGQLPDDFWGLVSKPYVDGKTWPLEPSPGIKEEIQYTSAGESRYYRVIGKDLYLYPATGADVTIKGDYFQKAAKVSQMEDVVPFSQLLDDAIQEYLLTALMGGPAASEGTLGGFMAAQVDLVVNNRSKGAAPQFPDGIQWGSL